MRNLVTFNVFRVSLNKIIMISQCEIELQKENRDNRTQSGIKAMYIKYQVAVAVAVASVANGVY